MPRISSSPMKTSRTQSKAKSSITTGILSSPTVLLSAKSPKKTKRPSPTFWTFRTSSPKVPTKIKTSHSSSSSKKILTSIKLPLSGTCESMVAKPMLSKAIRSHGKMANGLPTKRRKSPTRKQASPRLTRERKSAAFLTFSSTGMQRTLPNFKKSATLS